MGKWIEMGEKMERVGGIAVQDCKISCVVGRYVCGREGGTEEEGLLVMWRSW